MKKIISVFTCAVMFFLCFTACGNKEAFINFKKTPVIPKADVLLKEFEPGNNYKSIVPYIDRIVTFRKGNAEKECCYYGFAKTNGEKITAGIYSEIRLLTSENGKSIYVATTFEDEYGIKKALLISTDGSSVTETKCNDYRYSEKKNCSCIIFYSKGYKHGEVYNFSGKKICDRDYLSNVFYYSQNENKLIISVTGNTGAVKKQSFDPQQIYHCVDTKGNNLYDLNFGSLEISHVEGNKIYLENSNSKTANISDLNGRKLLKSDYSEVIFDSATSSYLCFSGSRCYRISEKGVLLRTIGWSSGGGAYYYDYAGSAEESAVLVVRFEEGHYEWYNLKNGSAVTIDNSRVSAVQGYNGKTIGFVFVTLGNGGFDVYSPSGTYVTTISRVDTLLDSINDKIIYTDTSGNLIVRNGSGQVEHNLSITDYIGGSVTVENLDNEKIVFSNYATDGKTLLTSVYSIGTQSFILRDVENLSSYSLGGDTFYTYTDGDFSITESENNGEIVRTATAHNNGEVQ